MIASDGNAEGWLYNYTLDNPIMPGDNEKRRIFDQLVKEIGFGGDVAKSPDGSVTFTVVRAWPSGFGLGWDKGYVLKPIVTPNQGSVVHSLDQARRNRPGAYYRQVDTDWYLFYFSGER